MTNELKAVFGPSKYCRTASRYQWDKGQTLKLDGIPLPNAYRVDFSNDPKSGETISQIGDASGVHIPNTMFESGRNIYAWVVLAGDNDDERTVYVVEIPIKSRPRPENAEPTPEEQSALQEAIAALNKAASRRVYVDDNNYLHFEEGGDHGA